MRTLVTGGAGFIGSHLVDALLDAGHEVAVIDDLSTGYRVNVNPRAHLYETDIRSDAVADIIAEVKPAVIHHLAAQMNVTRSLSEPVFDAEVNVQGTLRLLDAAAASGVGRFVFSSTAGAIYGDPDELPASEETVPRPLSHYGTSKLCAENYIRLYHRLYGLSFVILRYANVYGPRQVAHGECGICPVLISMMRAGQQPTLFGHGTCLRDYVYVGDVVRANLLAMEKGAGETVNVASGVGTSVQTLFDLLKCELGYGGEAALAPLRKGEVEHIYASADRAREVLGWRAETPLAEGLKRCIETESVS